MLFEKFKRDKSRIPGYHETMSGRRSNSRFSSGDWGKVLSHPTQPNPNFFFLFRAPHACDVLSLTCVESANPLFIFTWLSPILKDVVLGLDF